MSEITQEAVLSRVNELEELGYDEASSTQIVDEIARRYIEYTGGDTLGAQEEFQKLRERASKLANKVWEGIKDQVQGMDSKSRDVYKTALVGLVVDQMPNVFDAEKTGPALSATIVALIVLWVIQKAEAELGKEVPEASEPS